MNRMTKYFVGIFMSCAYGVVFAQSALTVEVVRPQMASFEQGIKATGYIVAKDLVLVNSQVNGLRLDKILVDIGAQVRKGQVLAVFDDDLLQQGVIQAKAQAQQAEIAYQEAKNNAQRATQLLKSNAISQVDGQKMISGAKQAKARLDAAKAQLNIQLLQVKHAKVVAPVSGMISDKKAVLGMTALPGQPLFQIISGNRLAWQAKLGFPKLADVHVGQSATVSLPDGVRVYGKVYNISPTLDAQTREATVFVQLADTPSARSGMLVNGMFTESTQQYLSLPERAIQRDNTGAYVWVVAQNDMVHKAYLTLGVRRKDIAAVTHGLQGDERVVLGGGGFLNEGDKVNVVHRVTEGR